MKASKVIDLLCSTISALDYITRAAVTNKADARHEGSTNGLLTDEYMSLSETTTVLHAFWHELPEDLRDDETAEIVAKAFPHLYEDSEIGFKWGDWDMIVSKLHRRFYKMWQEMQDVQAAASVYD